MRPRPRMLASRTYDLQGSRSPGPLAVVDAARAGSLLLLSARNTPSPLRERFSERSERHPLNPSSAPGGLVPMPCARGASRQRLARLSGPRRPCIIGLSVARSGSDHAVIRPRRGDRVERPVSRQWLAGLSGPGRPCIIGLGVARSGSDQAVAVEASTGAAGVGGGEIARLLELGQPAVEMESSGVAAGRAPCSGGAQRGRGPESWGFQGGTPPLPYVGRPSFSRGPGGRRPPIVGAGDLPPAGGSKGGVLPCRLRVSALTGCTGWPLSTCSRSAPSRNASIPRSRSPKAAFRTASWNG